MTKSISYAALVAALAIAGPSLAQSAQPAAPAAQPGSPATTSATPPSSPAPASATPSTTNPAAAPSAAPTTAPATSAAPTGSSTDTAAHAGSAALMSGMSVKDNTGALIGEVKSIKGGLATISMGSSTFTVDSDKLGVTGGAATINASQAEIKGMLPKK